MKAVYPGSFDPITNGHIDIVKRGSKLFDELVIVLITNPSKKYLFPVEERLDQIKTCVKNFKNVTVMEFDGLTVDFVRKINADVILRGLRAVSDFENEFQMALINKHLNNEVETLFISTSTNYLFLSSSAVKEVAMFGGDLSTMVDKEIAKQLYKKYNIDR